jgi:hypothetical protein
MPDELINERLNMLNALSGPDPGRTTVPVRDFLQEAENFCTSCQKDKEALTGAGLDWKFVEDLPVRIGALRVSEAYWKSEYKHSGDCDAEWGIAVHEAYNLRDELVHHFYHALRKKPVAYSRVQEIDKGGTSADMIQDLIELAELGRKHKKELLAIGFKLEQLDEARNKSFELSEQLAKVNSARMESSPLRVLRNRAYAHLKEAVLEIREVGQYLFWRDKDKYVIYLSPYIRKINGHRKK